MVKTDTSVKNIKKILKLCLIATNADVRIMMATKNINSQYFSIIAGGKLTNELSKEPELDAIPL